MRKSYRSMLGVTLLEVLLVLAIAAMIIVMSVRYYQSASSSQQSNAILEQIQAITAAADSLAQASGSYQTGNVSTSTVLPLVPNNSMTTPWGTNITIAVTSASVYTVTIDGMPSGVCPLVNSRLLANTHYTTSTTCSTTGPTDYTYTYTANP
jgi:type II secretory pathway pseudopilin PulG